MTVTFRFIGGPLADETLPLTEDEDGEFVAFVFAAYPQPDAGCDPRVARYRVFPKFKTAVYEGDK